MCDHVQEKKLKMNMQIEEKEVRESKGIAHKELRERQGGHGGNQVYVELNPNL